MIIRLLLAVRLKRGIAPLRCAYSLGLAPAHDSCLEQKPSFQHRKDGEACIPPAYTLICVCLVAAAPKSVRNPLSKEQIQLVARSCHNYVSAPKKRMGRKARFPA